MIILIFEGDMAYEIEEIKEIRKRLGLTQGQLAQRAAVSQSLIAKVESGRLDPAYSKAKKIFKALDSLGTKKELKAWQIMNRKVLSVKPGEGVRAVIEKMKKAGISQMPVIEENKSIGVISESIILEALLNKKGNRVEEIMEDSAPVVSKNTSISAVSNLLRFCPMVLVSDNGKLKGVITKSDLLGNVYR